MLLVSAGMLGRTVLRLAALNPGSATGNSYHGASGSPPREECSHQAPRCQACVTAARAHGAVSGVQSVTLTDIVRMWWVKTTCPTGLVPCSTATVSIAVCVGVERNAGLLECDGIFFATAVF